jgi:hypothetical protein
MVLEHVKMIGLRAGVTNTTTGYDVVVLHTESIRFENSNPIFVMPIPSTGNATVPTTKLINLKRVSQRIIITGYIADTVNKNQNLVDTGTTLTDPNAAGGVAGYPSNSETPHNFTHSDGSARGCGYTASTGVITGGTACVKSIEKKWILEQFALAGANLGIAHTLQWRNIKTTSGTDSMKNLYSEKVFISELTITDDNSNATSYDAAGDHFPNSFKVQMTLVVGSPSS